MSRIFIWSVRGMHCASCERTIEQVLKTIPNVEETEVSLKKHQAGVRVSDTAETPNMHELNQLLQEHGYQLMNQIERVQGEVDASSTCDLPSTGESLGYRLVRGMAIMFAVSLFGWLILRPLRHLVPAVSVQGSFVALFGFGAVASVSTCLASTGAFLLAYTAQQTSKKKILWMHLGRLIAFFVGGVALGGLGSLLPSLHASSGILTLILGIGFLWVGLHFLDLAPSLASMGLRLPKKLNLIADRVSRSSSPIASFLVGAVTFLLPCGFTQTAQALALASGSPWKGGILLSVFALGTLPVLAGISTFGSLAALRQRSLRLVTGAFLILFAFGQVDGGLTVLGSSFTFHGSFAQAQTALVDAIRPLPVQAQEQIVNMTVGYGAFTPNHFTIKAGIPVRWRVNGVDISGCASTIVSPKIGLTRDLHLGLNEIQFTPREAGVIPFSCSMGMIRGSFVVVR